ncbi:polysaccharide deacetylase family protein [Paenibacillus sp. HJL G12]|uniref:Polysaccharide deacetylase family protein n=1 Tax=Paenibacillus dendrobii TaxID=2691084 RepID=A0A7X3IM42_9BACL|nr:polysaccharide deacetylase family protein [Paenibacillus dendrobii]MWV45941.1 polysaccharide deacetylase family protein [Paenibacillus dendrobii]
MLQSYLTKWIEIRSIEKNESGACLMNVDFVNGQSAALIWKVDSFTADHIDHILTEAISPDVKFRLSFLSECNPVDKQYYAQITEYSRRSSRAVKFGCSESFAKQLGALKKISDFSELRNVSSFIHEASGPKKSQELQEPAQAAEPAGTRRKPGTWIQLAAALLAVPLLFYLAFTGFSHMNEKVLANKEPASSSPSLEDRQVTLMEQAEKRIQPIAAVVPAVPQPTPLKEETPLPAAVNMDKKVNYSVPKNSVAITFDDGPSKYTKGIVDVLRDYHVGGTFFFVGTQVRKFPESVKYVDDNGFSIGNHSMTHPNLQKLSVDKQKAEIVNTSTLIEKITSKPVVLLRPPYGSMNAHTKEIAESAHMKIMLWNRDPEDWKSKNDAQKVLGYLEQAQAGGSVILLHESKETLGLLPTLIEYLLQQQVQIVNLM